MANWSKFEVYLEGPKEDIEAFNRAMEASIDSDYTVSEEFEKSLKVYKNPKSMFRGRRCIYTVEDARNILKNLGYNNDLEKFKDENLNEEYFTNIPKEKHFCGVVEYETLEPYKRDDKDVYISKSNGACLGDVSGNFFGTDKNGSYMKMKEIAPPQFFKGITLFDFAIAHPKLNVAIILRDAFYSYSEFCLFLGDELAEARREDFDERLFNEMYEEDDDEENIEVKPLKIPEWYKDFGRGIEVDEDYVFKKLRQ